MQSFRSEIENPVVEKDILDLAKKIAQFKAGEIHEEKPANRRIFRCRISHHGFQRRFK